MAMWKQVGFTLLALMVGLVSEPAEARFGKRSRPSSPPPNASPRPPPSYGGGGGPLHPNPFYGYYGHMNPWYRYWYYDPSWAWPFLGPDRPFQSFGRHYYYYENPAWRRRSRPSVQVEGKAEPPPKVDLVVDGGLVAQGFMTGLGLQVDGPELGFGARLNVLNLATDDGSPGRDYISLLSLKPGVLLVSREQLRVRVTAGVDAAFAPDAIMIGPGFGTNALVRLVGPLKLEASAQWTPLPFTQLAGDAGLAVDLGPLRLRGGYRAIYLSDQGRVEEGVVHREFFAGPYAGMSLHL
jgi:hypothetical protein